MNIFAWGERPGPVLDKGRDPLEISQGLSRGLIANQNNGETGGEISTSLKHSQG
jgi:hypothetical protein